MASEEDANAKYNKKGPAIWRFVKNAAFIVTLLFFLLSAILILDAYKFVSVRHANFARKKLMTSLQYMDPTIIESHTGFKVLGMEEYNTMQEELKEVRKNIREANMELMNKYTAVLKASSEIETTKKALEDLKKFEAEAEEEKKKKAEEEAAAAKAVEEEKKEEVGADAVEEKKEGDAVEAETAAAGE
eukprot:scaffold51375_cov37-Cyclotella_meneghiniana.AAC.2